MGALTLTIMLVVAIAGIALSVVFRRYVDAMPVVSLGLQRHLHRNDAWAGLLLSIFLLGLGSLILYFTAPYSGWMRALMAPNFLP